MGKGKLYKRKEIQALLVYVKENLMNTSLEYRSKSINQRFLEIAESMRKNECKRRKSILGEDVKDCDYYAELEEIIGNCEMPQWDYSDELIDITKLEPSSYLNHDAAFAHSTIREMIQPSTSIGSMTHPMYVPRRPPYFNSTPSKMQPPLSTSTPIFPTGVPNYIDIPSIPSPSPVPIPSPPPVPSLPPIYIPQLKSSLSPALSPSSMEGKFEYDNYDELLMNQRIENNDILMQAIISMERNNIDRFKVVMETLNRNEERSSEREEFYKKSIETLLMHITKS